jgi:hypothetical protein
MELRQQVVAIASDASLFLRWLAPIPPRSPHGGIAFELAEHLVFDGLKRIAANGLLL